MALWRLAEGSNASWSLTMTWAAPQVLHSCPSATMWLSIAPGYSSWPQHS